MCQRIQSPLSIRHFPPTNPIRQHRPCLYTLSLLTELSIHSLGLSFEEPEIYYTSSNIVVRGTVDRMSPFRITALPIMAGGYFRAKPNVYATSLRRKETKKQRQKKRICDSGRLFCRFDCLDRSTERVFGWAAAAERFH